GLGVGAVCVGEAGKCPVDVEPPLLRADCFEDGGGDKRAELSGTSRFESRTNAGKKAASERVPDGRGVDNLAGGDGVHVNLRTLLVDDHTAMTGERGHPEFDTLGDLALAPLRYASEQLPLVRVAEQKLGTTHKHPGAVAVQHRQLLRGVGNERNMQAPGLFGV